MAVTFESYSRRIDKITKCLSEYGISSLEEAKQICTDKGIDVEAIVKGIQPIAFENAVWAYTVGCAIAIKRLQEGSRRCGSYRYRTSKLLYPRFCCRAEKGRSRTRQSRGNAFERRDQVLRFPRRTRILCGSGRRDRYRYESQQGQKTAFAGHPQRLG